jgi:hypothetical protein
MCLFILTILGLTAGSIIDPKKEVTKERAQVQAQAQAQAQNSAVTWDTWRAVKTEASKALDEGKWDIASQLFREYARQGEVLKELKIQGWGLNNAAYALIMKHKQNRSTDLTLAKEYIEKALAINEIDEQCTKVLESNQAYVMYWAGKNTPIRPSDNVTKEAVPKKK